MNPHLTALEFSEYFIGGATPFVKRHAQECARCRADVAQLGDSLTRFREAVQRWSSREDRRGHRVVFRAKPVALAYGSPGLAGLSSLAVHCGLVAFLLFMGTFHPVQTLVKQQITALELDLRPYLTQQSSSGGGGGGAHRALDASKGRLPKPAPRQFTPPRVDPVEVKLQLPPSIVAPDGIPNLQANNFGDPLSRLGIPSNGNGLNGGIGFGSGGGVGSGTGAALGGFGSGAYRIGGAVSAPSVLFKVEPEYSEEARKAKWQGVVTLSVIVDETGRPKNINVVRSLGLGLDQKAVEAVSQWRFKPGLKDGKPVPVFATIEVNFRLL